METQINETKEEYVKRINAEQIERHRLISFNIKIASDLIDNGIKDVTFIYSDGRKEKRRIFKSAIGNIAVFRKGSRKYGYPISDEYNLKEIIPCVISKVTEEEKWLKSINRAIKILSESGLWTNILENLKQARVIGFNRFKEVYALYNKEYSKDYKENEEMKIREFECKTCGTKIRHDLKPKRCICGKGIWI